NGRDLTGWKGKNNGDTSKSWKVGKARLAPNPKELAIDSDGEDLVNYGGKVDIYTSREFWDWIIHAEVLVAKGANSAIYLQGEYEIQIVDSPNYKVEPDTRCMGALYGLAAPRVNAERPAGQWQRLRINFRAPRFSPLPVENAPKVKM